MAYSYDQIIQAYTALRIGKAPDKATADNLQLTAGMNAGGQLSDARVMNILVNGADATTAVAVLTYQFFTGKSPTQAGLTYLVNSPINTNDLNDAYYAKFNLENRYINFSANLGLYGEGATAFANKYGAMDFASYVASIYQTIIGRSYAEAAGVNVDAAVAYLIGTKDAVLQTVRESGMVTSDMTTAQVDLAVKAAMAGLVMAASIKADIGLYAAAGNNFMVALAQGTAVYNTNITVTYAPSYDTASHGTGHAVDRPPANLPDPVTDTPVTPSNPHLFILRASGNHITATAQDDTFNGKDTTLRAGDVLNGGGGNDTLNITTAAAFTLPTVTVTDIETVNFTLSGRFDAFNWSGWTGMTRLNLTSNNATLAVVNIPTTTDVNVTTGSPLLDASKEIIISGGNDVTVTATAFGLGGVINVSSNTGDTFVTRTNTGQGAHATISMFNPGGDIVINQIADLTGIANGDTLTHGAVSIDGGVNTHSVEIVSTAPVTATAGTVGIASSSVGIYDITSRFGTGLGSITSIKVDGFAGSGPISLDIQDNALTDLTIAHGAGEVRIQNGPVAVGRATTLNLNVNDVNIGLTETANVYTTLNVTTGATDSTFSNITSSSLTTLTVGGTSRLTLTSVSGATSLHTVTVTDAAKLYATFGAGDDTITLGAGTSRINTGAGTDHVIVTAAHANSNTAFSTLFASAGDTLQINGQGGAAAFTGVMGAAATGATFQDYLNNAASGDGHTTSNWSWFQYGGDTYIVLDSSASNTFQAGTDIVVALVGVHNEAGATITGGELTLQ